MNSPTIKTLASYFLARQSERVLLATHVRPDGDAIGSIFGLASILNNNKIQTDIYLPESISLKYSVMLPDIHPITNQNAIQWEKYDVIIALDTANLDRLQLPPIPEAIHANFVVIDHHIDNTYYGKINFICALSSNSEIIFRATQMAGFEISPISANALLLGVLTDTGSLRFSNTNTDSCNCVGNLLYFGADHQLIINQLYFSKSLNEKHFESELILNHLQFYANGKIAIAIIPPSLLKKYDIDMRNMESLIDEVRCIEGVEIAILLSQLEDTKIKASLRSKNIKYPVGPIARSLGGGGHDMASGITFNSNCAQDIQNILSEAFIKLF